MNVYMWTAFNDELTKIATNPMSVSPMAKNIQLPNTNRSASLKPTMPNAQSNVVQQSVPSMMPVVPGPPPPHHVRFNTGEQPINPMPSMLGSPMVNAPQTLPMNMLR